MISQSPRVDELQWFALRDLKRPNAKRPAYMALGEMGIDVFTPMHWVLKNGATKTQRVKKPVLQDLLFVHSTLNVMSLIVQSTDTLQFRYSRGVL